MPELVNIYDAKTQLSRLVDRAAAGEEILIGRAGKPLVRLVPDQPGHLHRMVAEWDCIVRNLRRVADGRVKPVHDVGGKSQYFRRLVLLAKSPWIAVNSVMQLASSVDCTAGAPTAARRRHFSAQGASRTESIGGHGAKPCNAPTST
jgi:prevent-host-death family protein